MIEMAVSVGVGKAEISGTVGCVVDPIVIDGQRGFTGVTGREWERYQRNTLWPNLEGSWLAPTTAKLGVANQALRAVSMVSKG